MEKNRSDEISKEISFEVFYRKNYFRMQQYCFQFYRRISSTGHLDDFDAEDIVAEAFAVLVAIWEGMSTHTEAGLTYWMMKTVKNKTYSFCKKQSKAPPVLELEEWLAAEEPGPEEDVLGTLQIAADDDARYEAYLQAVRERLNPRQQALFDHAIVGQKSISESAKLLDMKENTVKVNLWRLRQKLKQDILPEILREARENDETR